MKPFAVRPASRRLLASTLTLTLTLTAACSWPEVPDRRQDSPAPTQPAEPWIVEDASVDAEDGLRVLVLHDMEGLSGQDDWRTFDFQHPDLYARGQELLAADINAVIEGLFAGGATEVHVVDGHGSGNPEPDVRADLLDPRATQVLRDEPFDTYFDLPEAERYDAVAVVGMHAKTGSGGFASHTFTLGIELQVNGRPITETELVALSWGRFGVPVIFGSGDDRLAADLQTMPWIEFVTVKEATSASTAEPRPVNEARADLTAGARRALEGVAGAKVMRVQGPVTATIRTVPPASLRPLADVPGVDYDADADAVTFEAADLRAAYDGLVGLVAVATARYSRVLSEVLRERGLAEEVSLAFNDALMTRWLDVESDRWNPPQQPPQPADRLYHGYR